MIVSQRLLNVVGIEVWLAGVDGRAVRQERMSETRAAIILQGPQPGIAIDLITTGSQVTGADIATEIVAI